MIRFFFTSDLAKKRLKRFKSLRRSVASTIIFATFIFVSLTAELWANRKPILLHYQGRLYAPALRDVHPEQLGQEGFVTDYRKLSLQGSGDWALWPPIGWDPFEINDKLSNYPAPPSRENLFGTDDRGRDVLARLIYGFRYSVGFAVALWACAFLVGTLAGAAMGYAGGRLDLIGQRVVEIFDSLPYLLMLMTLIALLGASLPLLVGFSVALGWMRISTFMRAEFLRLRNRDFVEGARAQGIGTSRILARHILPNALSPLITFSPSEIASGITTLATLDYLGLGLPPPTPSWGELLQQAQANFTVAWWLALYPSMAMIIALTALTFIGEGVREAYDPRK